MASNFIAVIDSASGDAVEGLEIRTRAALESFRLKRQLEAQRRDHVAMLVHDLRHPISSLALIAEVIDAGWFDEVAQLMRTIPPDAPAWNASGYGTIRAGLEGSMTRDAVIERVIIETRQYAKRQRTWCRHQLQDGTVTQLNPNAPDALKRALAWWDASSAEAL